MRVRIDELSEITGISRDELAERMSISRSYLYALLSETSDKRFNSDHFESMLKIFDCSVHDLFEDDIPGKKRLLQQDTPLNEQFLMTVLTQFFDLLSNEPSFVEKKSPKQMADLVMEAYRQGLEESEETGRPAEISKASIRGMLRLVHGGKH